jgi:hypothetical protein
MSLWYFGANRAPILHRQQRCLQMDQNEIPQDPCHLGVSSGASKTIFQPIVCSVQIVPLSCVKISTISKWTEMSFRLSLISSEYYRVHLKRFSAYGMFGANPARTLRQDEHYLQTDRSKLRLESRHLAIPSSASKTIS